ncbi:MAG: hypothetical protein IPJ17_08525 [Holophagales bacterium]|nr:MAG: hypothetical protein IPJ17_08525 [Holophagales bacterium]
MPRELAAHGFWTESEGAWPRDAALAVLEWLASEGIGIRGIEIWMPSANGPIIPTPDFYSWAPPVGRCGEEAKGYRGREPFFCIELDNEW